MNNIFYVIIILAIVGCKVQNTTNIKQIEFNTSSRGGGYEQVIITKEMVTVNLAERRSETRHGPINQKMKSQDWENLQKVLNNIALDSVDLLKSPTMDRTFDGARHSALIITPMEGSAVTHGFDNENPHDALKPLMRVISQMKESIKGK